MDWKFHDDPNTACFTTSHVLSGAPILRVYHDYDGDWQFHGEATEPAQDDEAKLVCLRDIVDREPSVAGLHDLPYGWRAERASSSTDWTRHKDHSFPSYSDDGYYLEDALWLSEYIPEINPPDEEIRENLQSDQYVKLVFRFANEDSERADNECERMWVRVAGRDDDGNYFGTIENDPNHDAASCGDPVIPSASCCRPL
jgi:hypothetical protein